MNDILSKDYHSPSSFYAIKIPQEWAWKEEKECVSFFNSNGGAGALQISSYRVNHDVNIFDELKEYITDRFSKKGESDNHLKKIKGDKHSARLDTVIDNYFWIYYMIFNAGKFLFITYNCALSDKDNEVPIITAIINSVVFK